ncbi:hypothetical protein RSOL_269460 [Rhizoctonia solani AG-3 Rhs1AP]|uniref:Uncharacterized protein n=1 Tax=Rhizoctonia solani AG-3 Rhs1AP TaxID=1086054 RepID=A0A0A1UJS1_9AGAM|nr:hypothetical protein RSOL_269460 [Rhizoctonia solani AG-3 Rhs1AP]
MPILTKSRRMPGTRKPANTSQALPQRKIIFLCHSPRDWAFLLLPLLQWLVGRFSQLGEFYTGREKQSKELGIS